MDLRPDFYDRFSCLAGACRHSCCQGWEIDLDPDFLARCQAEPGKLGEDLRRSILRQEDGTPSFRLVGEEEKCPFLRPDGLCRLILEKGEDFLCDICALHPRFFQEIGSWELSGVGLCCEAAAALLLDQPGGLTLLDQDDRPWSFPQAAELLGLPFSQEELTFTPKVDADYYRAIFARYAPCEAIDAAWSRDLAALSATPEKVAEQARAYVAQDYEPVVFQRIFHYLLYRQLDLAEEYGLPALLRFAREGADFLLLWTAVTGDLADCLRRWSAQMEYSEDNVALLLGG